MIETAEANVVDPDLIRHVTLHLMITAFKGTADHLIKDHGIDADLIDRDDRMGLAHDHIFLHGGVTRQEPGEEVSTTHWENPHM